MPQVERLTPPQGSETLSVRIEAIAAEGVFPELTAETTAIVAPYEHRAVTLAELYAAASAIEAAHIKRGFVLARVTVPPQTLVDGGTVRFIVIDGFIEAVDTTALPSHVRAPVGWRVAGLTAKRHVTLGEIEQPLVLAGSVPGVALTSTLARGTAVGGARLILGGHHALVSGSVSADNGYAASLGRYGVTAQLSLNSLLGLGEQIYAIAVSGYDLSRMLRSDAPLRVLGGGVVLSSRSGLFTVNPEVTFSRTQPVAPDGVPRTRGTLSRYTLRGGYTIARTRRQSASIGASIEQIAEANTAIDFATRISLDRFRAGRVQLTYAGALAGGGGLSAALKLSHGLGGSPANAIASRQGASSHFTKFDASVRATRPLSPKLELSLIVKGQTGFGDALFRTEQTSLEDGDALSGYIGGETAVDSGVTARAEFAHAVAAIGARASLRISPYVFAAGGKGWIARPTMLEQGTLTLANAGAGARGAIGRTGLGFAIEYVRGLSHNPHFDATNRVSVATSLGF